MIRCGYCQLPAVVEVTARPRNTEVTAKPFDYPLCEAHREEPEVWIDDATETDPEIIAERPIHTDHSDRRACQAIGCPYGDH